ncbi:HupE/UreJ family protein [Phenylobacterium sp.]|jgi:urease accessory protein|uniref:HupE/UreJ family protein n=1 Tax=Phenylobacterium sp. TaxID=1871053 RepID=UPI002F40AF3A
MPKPLRRLRGFLATLFVLAPATAFAHPDHPGHEALGLDAGFLHPFTGSDHILAMVAVGLWAALRGGPALWAWPAAFVSAMAVGFAFGQAEALAFSVEPAMLASVIVLGALTAAQAQVPLVWGAILIGAFGAAHGYAHGTEAPGAGVGYPAGFALATASLHLAGLAAGLALRRFGKPEVIRLLGAGAAAGGLILAVAA